MKGDYTMNNDGIKKQEIMDILKVKEYWLDKEEQKIIEDYRNERWNEDEPKNSL